MRKRLHFNGCLHLYYLEAIDADLTLLGLRLFSSTHVHPAHFIDALVIPSIIQVLSFPILLALGFGKGVSAAALAAARELLRVMVENFVVVMKSHFCARRGKRQNYVGCVPQAATSLARRFRLLSSAL